jgi:hypothetical protein
MVFIRPLTTIIIITITCLDVATITTEVQTSKSSM